MFEWLIPLLILVLLLIWILDLPQIVGDALGGLVLAVIVGTVKLTAFLIRKLVTAGKPQP
ncbi:hypothetical protein [Bradyrhizobium sp. 170]|uniref:hypothetical protein n=1 Tax=Bradyrhizobium sp. 170 TaxID=2782641 RepID=UPI001FFF666C|nr:hypothetical protein [Bradyrhizobium sp. 170]UPK01645.1 hypothetical protein IVB05_28840 [Bradyrhizobium sp. 170]